MNEPTPRSLHPENMDSRDFGLRWMGMAIFWLGLLVLLVNAFWPVSVTMPETIEFTGGQLIETPASEVVNLGRVHRANMVGMVSATFTLIGLVMYFGGRLLHVRLDLLDAVGQRDVLDAVARNRPQD